MLQQTAPGHVLYDVGGMLHWRVRVEQTWRTGRPLRVGPVLSLEVVPRRLRSSSKKTSPLALAVGASTEPFIVVDPFRR